MHCACRPSRPSASPQQRCTRSHACLRRWGWRTDACADGFWVVDGAGRAWRWRRKKLQATISLMLNSPCTTSSRLRVTDLICGYFIYASNSMQLRCESTHVESMSCRASMLTTHPYGHRASLYCSRSPWRRLRSANLVRSSSVLLPWSPAWLLVSSSAKTT